MVHVPVAQAYVADSAPEDMRGRYMGAAGLTWGIGWAIGPLLAGLVMDGPHPQAVWYACLAVGLAAALAFLWLGRRRRAVERLALDEAGAAV
jgi:MFS family permease